MSLKTLELLEDGETVVCDDHQHVCPILWLAIRSVLVRLSQHQRELEEAEARVREMVGRLMKENPEDWTH
jgi:tagatose-1,6-bisphosphate aldolase non-catalytic subunit AgaZ/GatZ